MSSAGGLYAIIAAFAAIVGKLGVVTRTNADVQAIEIDPKVRNLR